MRIVSPTPRSTDAPSDRRVLRSVAGEERDVGETHASSDGAFLEVLAGVARLPVFAGPPSVGDTIANRYRLESVLGRGGMGTVFAAFDTRLGRAVAVKWTHRPLDESAEATARFVREARAAAKVSHPNVVNVFDVETDTGGAFLVMERLVGVPLRDRMRDGPIDWDSATALIGPALEGVAALHRIGIIHRDLKPENLFVCDSTEGSHETTKVLDFGVCRDTPTELGTLTKTGTLLGTPAYMSLEQLRGEREIGPATDVHALGVVFYEMLCGRRPFESRTAADQAVLLATTESPSLAARIPGIGRVRSEVVMRAIARDASDRYPSATAFAEAIRAASAPRGRARPLALTAGGIVILALSIGGWARWSAATPARTRSIAIASPAPARTHSASSPSRAQTPRRHPGEVSPSPPPAVPAPSVASETRSRLGRRSSLRPSDRASGAVMHPPGESPDSTQDSMPDRPTLRRDEF